MSGTVMESVTAQGLEALGLDGRRAAALARYGTMLLKQNEVMNLTAITEPEQVARLHFLDCAALLTCGVPLAGKRLIDVGTGAGFPGIVLKLLEPTLSLSLLDSLGKRVDWLAAVAEALSLADVTCLHARAEELSLKGEHREQYDIATSRAVADLPLLCELCLPYVKVGGHFLAMKGPACEEEISRSAKGVALLGGALRPSFDYQIPGTDVTHRVVIVEKTAPTPKGYPRRWAKMQKSPL